MGIPATQIASSKSQCKQRFMKNDRSKEGLLRNVITKPTALSHAVTVALLFLVTTTPSVTACPSGCSCNTARAMCNNQGYTETPVGFSSKIESIYLYNNNITKIRPETLQPLQNLKLLDLSGNGISDFALWGGMFDNMRNLENLILQENAIRTIPSSLFRGLKNLARIYLHRNRITTIEPGAFNNLPSLVELKLSHNQLKSFPMLRNTPDLLLLDLSFNNLGTIRDMAFSTVNLEHLMLQNNRLTELRTSIFDDTRRLTKLDISNNRLTAVPQVIKSLTTLRYLNMSLNNVGAISTDTFQGMKRLKTLDIHGMGLTNLPRSIIAAGVFLNRFDITENEWECGCEMHWLPEYMKVFRAAFIKPDEVLCSVASKFSGRKIEQLHPEDFSSCSDDELGKGPDAVSPSPTTPQSAHTTTTKSPWFPNPCAVYKCFHNGRCFLEGRLPKCRCARFWAGDQCKISLRPSTPTTSTTTTKSRVTSQKPKLVINKNSVTDRSVEIILPTTEQELDVTVQEIGNRQSMTSQRIRPRAQPFTIEGLESGKSYNICIQLPSERRRDTLCGTVRTHNSKGTENPIKTPEIRIVPSTDSSDENSKPGFGVQLGSNGESSDTSQNNDFKVIYPAVGAAVGAVIILSVLVMFFVCYRQRKIKRHNSSDYVPGSPMEPPLTDMEMTTVVHHHHHNHYNANRDEQKAKNGRLKSKKNSKFTNNNSAKSVTSQKSSSLSRNSVASSSNSGTVQSRFTDTPQQYQPQYMTPTPPNIQPYESIPAPRANGRTDYMFRQPTMNTSVPIANMHCMPMSRHYEPEMLDDTQPMLADMGQYGPYSHEERRLYPEYYPANHRNDYTPQSAPVSSYPAGNPRSAFQPIQSPRKNTVRTPTSDSGPITTYASTAHILPTASCLNSNLVGDSMLRYPESVPVV